MTIQAILSIEEYRKLERDEPEYLTDLGHRFATKLHKFHAHMNYDYSTKWYWYDPR